MEYLIFTYPSCLRCEELKNYIKEKELISQEYDLVLKESKLKIREFLSFIKRDEKGAIIIPTLVLQQGGEVVTVLNSPKELEDWLKSKA